MTTRTRTLDDLAGSDTIDSRDLIARLQELESLIDPADTEDTESLEEEREELESLRAICDEGESSFSDWEYGAQLIRESYFTEYAQELAEDIGAIGRESQWPLEYIDWERAADALKMDYSTIEIEGDTYYGRS